MADQVIAGYIDCGEDSDRVQVVIYLPAMVDLEIKTIAIRGDEVVEERATIRYMHDVTRTLNGQHTAVFLEKIGLRQPKSNRIVVPEPQYRFGQKLRG